MSYTEFRDGYKRETTFGSSIITAVGDVTYLFGAVHQASEHPSPVAMIQYTNTGYNTKEVGAGLMWKATMASRGMYGITMQNGVIILAAMGKRASAGGGPYTHTITPTTDGSLLPSYTINHEQKRTATNEEYQFMGCKVDSLTLVFDMKEAPFLMAKVEWIAAQAQDGIALTNDPILPATANTDAYVQLQRVWDTGGTPVNIDGLQRVEIIINNGLRPIYGHTYDTTVYTGQWPYMFLEANRKQYQINMLLHPNTVERRMWDSLISTTTAITTTFKFLRSATDYILCTATGPIVEHQLITPAVGEELLEMVTIEPYAMAFEVVDMIPGATYDE